jgi:histidine kinase
VLLVTASDITKRLEAEGQLIQASKLATLGEMATGVAHELNQPLSVIKTASSFCLLKFGRDESMDPELLTRMLQKVDGNVDRATRIIHHMRQFARKSEIHLARVRVETVLEKACEFFSQQLKVRGIEVEWEVEPDLPPVMVDAGRLEQVFINLLINARDAIEDRHESFAHAEDGGGETPDRRIFLRVKREGDGVRIDVADTGAGIPREVAEKVFEPFFTTKEVGKGTGLGLSISYGIVRDCGGTIEAGSEPGGGACFTIRFPAAPPEENENGRTGDLLKEKLIAEP